MKGFWNTVFVVVMPIKLVIVVVIGDRSDKIGISGF